MQQPRVTRCYASNNNKERAMQEGERKRSRRILGTRERLIDLFALDTRGNVMVARIARGPASYAVLLESRHALESRTVGIIYGSYKSRDVTSAKLPVI